MTIISNSCFKAKHLFNEVAHIAQSDLMTRNFKDLWNTIQGLSSTCPVFKYFIGLEFRGGGNSSTFKDFQRCVGTLSSVTSDNQVCGVEVSQSPGFGLELDSPF